MKYQIIYADPPWHYKKYSEKVVKKAWGDTLCHYKTMSVEDICKLPIELLADDNCILFIWTTMPFLDRVFEVIKACIHILLALG